jgi:hypothetical protein
MPLNCKDADYSRIGADPVGCLRKWVVGTVIKFPDEGRIVRFGRVDAQDESATVIILPVIRIERYADPVAENVGPNSPPPAANKGGRRRARRR